MPHNYVESYNACIRKETKKDFEGFERFWDQGFSKTHKEMLDKSEKSNVKADKKWNKGKRSKGKTMKN